MHFYTLSIVKGCGGIRSGASGPGVNTPCFCDFVSQVSTGTLIQYKLMTESEAACF